MASNNNKEFNNSLKLCHLNIRSLANKFDIFQLNANITSASIVGLSETWLSDCHLNNVLTVDGYQLIRKDRMSRGGGVAFYIKNNIHFTVIFSEIHQAIEQLWIKLMINNKSIAVGVIYRPPQNNYKEFVEHFEKCVLEFSLQYDYLICLGDFNINLLQLSKSTTDFNRLLNSLSLKQLINEPTRVTPTSQSLIDFIITGENNIINRFGVIDMNDLSDHALIYCEFLIEHPLEKPIIKKMRNIKNIDTETFIADLYTLNWYHIFDIEDVNNKVDFFNNNLNYLLNLHAPLREVNVKKKSTPWLTYNIKEMIKLKENAYKRYKKSKNPIHFDYYKSLRNYTNKAIQVEKRAYMQFQLDKCKGNKKYIWNVLKNNNFYGKRKIPIPENIKNPGSINNYFVSEINHLSVDTDTVNFYNNNRINIEKTLIFSTVTNSDVIKIIQSLKSHAIDVNGHNLVILKMCCNALIDYITHIINACITTSKFPNNWKESLIIPVPKINSPVSYKDLRPINILPVLSKVLEKILEKQIRLHLSTNNILPEFQSGFRPGYSCNSALSCVTDDIIGATDAGKITALVLVDYSKAFDRLNHTMLEAILKYVGFSAEAGEMMMDFFTNRTQKVVVDNKISPPLRTSCGVGQGTILGPLIYSVYTILLPTAITHSKYHMYADDTQIYTSFYPHEYQTAEQKLNSDLSNLQNYSQKHALLINESKSKLILFGSKNQRNTIAALFNINLNGNILPPSECVKNLGIYLDSNLRFKENTNLLIKKAYAALKSLYINRQYINQTTKIMLCDTLVLSNFNFCDTLYHNCLDKQDVYKIQKMQNSCLRFIYGIRRSDRITHKLKTAKWLNMLNRRKLHSICFYHKILESKKPPYLYQKIRYRSDIHNINVRRRGTLDIPKHNLEIYKRCFSYSIVQCMNSVSFSYINFIDLKIKYRTLLNNTQ